MDNRQPKTAGDWKKHFFESTVIVTCIVAAYNETPVFRSVIARACLGLCH